MPALRQLQTVLGIGPDDQHPLADAEGVQVTLVAVAGFEPATFRL